MAISNPYVPNIHYKHSNTQSTLPSSSSLLSVLQHKKGYVGLPLPFVEVRLVEEETETTVNEFDTPGELRIKVRRGGVMCACKYLYVVLICI